MAATLWAHTQTSSQVDTADPPLITALCMQIPLVKIWRLLLRQLFSMRDLGSLTSRLQSAFYLNLGLESLHVRMAQHCKMARQLPKALVSPRLHVCYPDLPGDKYYELAQKYLPNGSCGVITDVVGREAAEMFLSGLRSSPLQRTSQPRSFLAVCTQLFNAPSAY